MFCEPNHGSTQESISESPMESKAQKVAFSWDQSSANYTTHIQEFFFGGKFEKISSQVSLSSAIFIYTYEVIIIFNW